MQMSAAVQEVLFALATLIDVTEIETIHRNLIHIECSLELVLILAAKTVVL
jgi:hypothetical protein